MVSLPTPWHPLSVASRFRVVHRQPPAPLPLDRHKAVPGKIAWPFVLSRWSVSPTRCSPSCFAASSEIRVMNGSLVNTARRGSPVARTGPVPSARSQGVSAIANDGVAMCSAGFSRARGLPLSHQHGVPRETTHVVNASLRPAVLCLAGRPRGHTWFNEIPKTARTHGETPASWGPIFPADTLVFPPVPNCVNHRCRVRDWNPKDEKAYIDATIRG